MRIGNWDIFKKVDKTPKKEAHYTSGGSWSVSFDGEKNLGEIGPIKDYTPNYNSLRLRSWQSFLESEITQTIVKKYTLWVVGGGLKLQSEPSIEVLNNEGITIDYDDFTDKLEANFNLFAGSTRSDFAGLRTLHKIASIAHKNSIIGGDVLVVLRVDKKYNITVQLVDGAHVQSPFFGDDFYGQKLTNGNSMKNGIEISPTGAHVAYHVKKKDLTFERIEAYGAKSGIRMAYLVTGLEYRLDNTRGLPLISAVLETLKKMERYKEATLGSAEERQKIVYFIEHMLGSTGESPLTKGLAKAFSSDANDDLPTDANGTALADNVAVSTNKTTFNLTPNSTIKSLESKNELYFKEFYSVNIDLIAAAVGIPREVAMSIFDSNFSASRAALKDWEHSLNVNRLDFSNQFYQPIYNLFFEIQVLKNKIQAPMYLGAEKAGDYHIVDAYRNARFIGVGVPHIDPLKEVQAERAKLGILADHLPLTTLDRSTEILNGGNYKANLANFKKMLEESKDIKPPVPDVPEQSA